MSEKLSKKGCNKVVMSCPPKNANFRQFLIIGHLGGSPREPGGGAGPGYGIERNIISEMLQKCFVVILNICIFVPGKKT